MKNLFCLFLVTLILLSGCVGPLVSHETARTVGDSNHELIAGYGQAGYVFKWNYGVTENLDVGVHSESLSFGFRVKYAFINNNKSGISLASALGAGVSAGGRHSYIDFIGSYFTGSWEPYGTVRLVHVSTDTTDNGIRRNIFTADRFEYSYGEFLFGTRYWFNEHWLVSAEAGSFFGISSGSLGATGLFGGAALGYRF